MNFEKWELFSGSPGIVLTEYGIEGSVKRFTLLCLFQGAFHSQKVSYTIGKDPFVFKKNPPKIRKNPFVVKESRTLFRKTEMPLGLFDSGLPFRSDWSEKSDMKSIPLAMWNHHTRLLLV